jgi:hypothetical protein
MTLVDEFLPVYDVSDAVATVVQADVATTWAALMDVDPIAVGRRRPMVSLLGALRTLPDIVSHVLHGEGVPSAPSALRLRDLASLPMNQGGWVLLGDRPMDEIALGPVGKFWRPVIEFAAVSSADAFRAFAEPGFAKTIDALSVRAIDAEHTLLTGRCARRAPTRTRGRGSGVLDVRCRLGCACLPDQLSRAEVRIGDDGTYESRPCSRRVR